MCHLWLQTIVSRCECLFGRSGSYWTLLWCRSLRGRQMCAKSIKTKIGRSNLPGFLIPLVKMLQLMGGIKPQDGFHKTHNWKSFFFWGCQIGHIGSELLYYSKVLWHWFNPSLVNREKPWLFPKHAETTCSDPSKWSSRGIVKIPHI